MKMWGRPGRHVLFLQGPGGTFFKELATELEVNQIRTSRINVCGGDWLLWRGANVHNFRGRFAGWQAYLRHYITDNDVTDIILFSDSRPYHRVAKFVSKDLGVNLFAFENGYLRPDWITLELGGVNGNSGFPRTRKEVEAAPAPNTEPFDTRQHPSILAIYGHDIIFHFANTLLAPLFPRYKRHRQTLPIRELIGWTKKAVVWPVRKRKSLQTCEKLFSNKAPFFLYALQLEHDFQLIEHSPFSSIRQASKRVIASFAEKAPKDALLLVKNHPLDNFVTNRKQEIAEIAEHFGVGDRVHFIDTGPNPEILDRAQGMVAVNSTLGTSALFHKLPVCVLGKAVYDVDGLTHQLGLDTFWNNPTKPDETFFGHFRRALIHACQIRGRFVTRPGRRIAVEMSAGRVMQTQYQPAPKAKVVTFEGVEKAVDLPTTAERYSNF
jgi:capsular polysaccharide export protein